MFRAAPQVLLTRPAYLQTIIDIKERRTKRLQPVLLSPGGGRLWALGLLYFPYFLLLFFVFRAWLGNRTWKQP
jgi:hypothetical protein